MNDRTLRPTIDDELAPQVRQAALDKGQTLRDWVNDAVRTKLVNHYDDQYRQELQDRCIAEAP